MVFSRNFALDDKLLSSQEEETRRIIQGLKEMVRMMMKGHSV